MVKDNKVTRIILGIALIGIWGLVIYRVVDAMRNKDIPNITPMTYWIDTISNDVHKRYELHLGYNDPFLKTGTFQSNHNAENNSYNTEIQTIPSTLPTTTIENLLPTKIKKVKFPTLEYLGVVTNKSTGQQLAVIKHNKQIYRIQKDYKIANCSVFSIDRDSIQISLKGNIQTIKR